MKALANAAFDLALEQGLDGFLVDDVVGRAGYSRRTFTNYFSCKEEAVATGAITFHDTIEWDQLLENLSVDTPPIDILFQLIKMQLTVDFFKRMRELALICKQHPSMEPYFHDVVRRLHVDAQEILMDLVNGKVDEVYIQLLVGAVYGGLLPVIDGSLPMLLPGQSTSDHEFHQHLEKIYGYLRNGF